MKQLTQNLKSGETLLEEVPVPQVKPLDGAKDEKKVEMNSALEIQQPSV